MRYTRDCRQIDRVIQVLETLLWFKAERRYRCHKELLVVLRTKNIFKRVSKKSTNKYCSELHKESTTTNARKTSMDITTQHQPETELNDSTQSSLQFQES